MIMLFDSLIYIYLINSGHACDRTITKNDVENANENDNNDNTCARSGVSVLSAIW